MYIFKKKAQQYYIAQSASEVYICIKCAKAIARAESELMSTINAYSRKFHGKKK